MCAAQRVKYSNLPVPWEYSHYAETKAQNSICDDISRSAHFCVYISSSWITLIACAYLARSQSLSLSMAKSHLLSTSKQKTSDWRDANPSTILWRQQPRQTMTNQHASVTCSVVRNGKLHFDALVDYWTQSNGEKQSENKRWIYYICQSKTYAECVWFLCDANIRLRLYDSEERKKICRMEEANQMIASSPKLDDSLALSGRSNE